MVNCFLRLVIGRLQAVRNKLFLTFKKRLDKAWTRKSEAGMRVLLHSRLHYNLTFYLLLCLDHKENFVINTNDNRYLRQFLQ